MAQDKPARRARRSVLGRRRGSGRATGPRACQLSFCGTNAIVARSAFDGVSVAGRISRAH
eukprot:4548554-Prymnesium_polylepis.1